jgi:chromosome segregation protein
MLKRLELVGFKSFADKTQFDFPEGITGIVGPNGSGKSNIVDAVRWVLGEQSAKSLRGGEMTDVIFNGSASRRSLGLAEVTMTFDNRRRSLATDAEEVQIGRRVYRGGEAEYLINQQICRLKDIKDLFLGSGAGNDAYSIIEQGRVDVLLQASTKDRRTIFEEAAGISRFKAKKIETLRKLERVDQNLQRLRDILEEVEKQLRSVKLQAAKAQRYQEYTERLKQLRVAVGLREYHELSVQLESGSRVLEELRATLSEQMARAEGWERELHAMEETLARLDGQIREQDAALAEAREGIATDETTLSHEWSAAGDVENDLAQTRLHLARLSQHINALADAARQAGVELNQVETQCSAHRNNVEALEEQLAAGDRRLAELQQQVDRDKTEHLDQMRQAARLQNDAVSFKAQVDNLNRERGRLRQRSEQAAEHLASLDLELQQLSAADEALQGRAHDAKQSLATLKQERESVLTARDETAQRANDLRAERSGVASRIEVLEGLERSHEGLGAGAREVFALLEQPDPGPWRTVLGILADVLHVRREYAPLIDLALGEQAQRFLVRDADQLAEGLAARPQPFSGRVSFLPLTPLAPDASAQEMPTHAGVIAPAAQVVRCDDPQMADLPARLLGRTLIVRDLAAARAVVAVGANCRCVTLQGELLEADGTLTVGTHHAETGILSRKSELRELREQAASLDRRVVEVEKEHVALRERLAQNDGRIENQQREIDVLAEQQADLRSRIGQHRQRREGLNEEVAVSRSEMSGLEQEIVSLEASWQQARDAAARSEALVQTLQGRIETAEREIREREESRQQHQQNVTAAKVGLAQVEERLSALRARHQMIEADRAQRENEHGQGRQQLDAMRARLHESQRIMLNASAALATWYMRKEEAERLLSRWGGEREQLRQARQQRAEQAQASRNTWLQQQEQAHAHELKVNDIRHQVETLCARLAEDYQLDLAALYKERDAAGAPAEPETESGTPPADEIAELRRKLSRLGNVNMEALQELTELEARASTLHIQFDDLTAAQKSLQEIINKINGDSRRLFTETFQTVRGHFQELFRKLFGGGMADVVLEDDADILESGIEIVARPPGKELRSISLMSGGEKTLTAVALLLAIFRSKPSPFCILDEVDAALDEANISRFTGVLREFLDRSQFIIITHSKRTMACADVLYGVTMQESGISRRFAVRFEDWPDDERKADEPAA